MREIKFRAWDKKGNNMVFPLFPKHIQYAEDYTGFASGRIDDGVFEDSFEIMQYTGLKDKNGKEIYELMELNNKWKVSYKAPKYILIDISTGDIIDFNEQNKYEITREYTDIPKDPKGSVD